MATRTELLSAFETALNGWILRADAYKHPFTKEWLQRYPQGENGEPPKAKVMPDERSAIIEVEEDPDGTKTLERHVCFYVDADKEVKANCQFYVINRGQADEQAWWLQGNDPKPPASEPSFQQKVLVWLRNRVGATVQGFTVKHIESATADEAAQTATARALGEDGTGYAWIDAFLSRDAEGNIQIEILEITRLGV